MKSVVITVKLKNRLRVQMAEVGCKSLRVLSEETGISKTLLHLVEKGTSSMSLENVFRLLYFFGCTFEELFQADVTTNEPDDFDSFNDETKAQIAAGRAEYAATKQKKADSV